MEGDTGKNSGSQPEQKVEKTQSPPIAEDKITKKWRKYLRDLTVFEWKLVAVGQQVDQTQLKGKLKNEVIHLALTKNPDLVDSHMEYCYFEEYTQASDNSVSCRYLDEEPKWPLNEYVIESTQRTFQMSKEKLIALVNTPILPLNIKPDNTEAFKTLGTFVEDVEDQASVMSSIIAEQHVTYKSQGTGDDKQNSTTPRPDHPLQNKDNEQFFLQMSKVLQENLLIRQAPQTPRILNQKIKYESDTEIQAFLKRVETNAEANGIPLGYKVVNIAIAAMRETNEGSLAVESLSQDDKSTWSGFKAKMVKLLGHSTDYYRTYFTTFKRGNMRLGIAFASLIQAFRRGYEIPDSRELNESEQRIISTTFIESLSRPLKIMIKTEQNSLKFHEIVERAQYIETCIGEDAKINALTGLESTEQCHVVQPQNTKTDEMLKILQKQHNDMLKLMQEQVEQSKKSHTSRNNTKRVNTKMTDEIRSAIKNLCIKYIMGQSCTFPGCKFKHEGEIPREATEAAQKYYSK